MRTDSSTRSRMRTYFCLSWMNAEFVVKPVLLSWLWWWWLAGRFGISIGIIICITVTARNTATNASSSQQSNIMHCTDSLSLVWFDALRKRKYVLRKPMVRVDTNKKDHFYHHDHHHQQNNNMHTINNTARDQITSHLHTKLFSVYSPFFLNEMSE